MFKEIYSLVVVLFLVIVMSILGDTLSYADHDGSPIQIEIITGEVISIDKENSNVVIKYKIDKENKSFANIILLVNKATIISRHGMKVGLYSLNVGDRVEVHVEKKSDEDSRKLRKAIIIEIRRSTNSW